MDTFERLKKIGATVIIVLLGLMMGIMFLPGDISDFTGTFVSTSMGSYNGRQIGQVEYGILYNQCSEQVPRVGNERFRDAMVKNCASQRARELFVLPDIGAELGIAVSSQSVEEQVATEAQMIYDQQRIATRDNDDRLSLDEIYLRQLRYAPISYRKLQSDAILTAQTLIRAYPFPEAQAQAARLTDRVLLTMSFVRYSSAQLQRKIEDRTDATEAEIRAAYESEQAKLAADKKRPFQEERANVRRRLLTSKREAELKATKAKLSKLGANFRLEEVSAITGFAAQRVANVSTSQLVETKVGAGTVNLALPELIVKIRPDANGVAVGPVTQDEFTYYIILERVIAPDATAVAKIDTEDLRKQGDELGRVMLREMIDQQAQRGDFKFKASRVQ